MQYQIDTRYLLIGKTNRFVIKLKTKLFYAIHKKTLFSGIKFYATVMALLIQYIRFID